MMRRIVCLGVVACLTAGAGSAAHAQVSAYASATYGYNTNPLMNATSGGDQMHQGYWEILYDNDEGGASALQLRYIGAMVLFNTLAPRNYYEHALSAGYLVRYDTVDDEPDPAGRTLALDARGTARHDRAAYAEFDNASASLAASYRSFFARGVSWTIANEVSVRSYRALPELSNIVDAFTLRIGGAPSPPVTWSLYGGVGLKHFTSTVTDTASFVDPQKGGSGHGQGQGKGKALGLTKTILTNSTTNMVFQLEFGGALGAMWNGGDASAALRYLVKPAQPSRYLAQNSSSSTVTEDLYNDHFSYQGPAITVELTQTLGGGLLAHVSSTVAYRTFEAPALDVDAVATGDQRKDLHGSLEVSVSRSFPLGSGVSLEAMVTGGVIRNQSNDAYNDYSGHAISLTVGVSLGG
jgi:hypothetical protein